MSLFEFILSAALAYAIFLLAQYRKLLREALAEVQWWIQMSNKWREIATKAAEAAEAAEDAIDKGGSL